MSSVLYDFFDVGDNVMLKHWILAPIVTFWAALCTMWQEDPIMWVHVNCSFWKILLVWNMWYGRYIETLDSLFSNFHALFSVLLTLWHAS